MNVGCGPSRRTEVLPLRLIPGMVQESGHGTTPVTRLQGQASPLLGTKPSQRLLPHPQRTGRLDTPPARPLQRTIRRAAFASLQVLSRTDALS